MARYLTLILCCLLTSVLCDDAPTEDELLEALGKNPADPWALFNLGLQRYLEGEYFESIELLGELVEQDPEDWQAREKLIQALSGADQDVRVEEEIAVLRQNWMSGDYKLLVDRGFFIREQFEVGPHRVFVFQYFSMEGERPLHWKFVWETKGEKADHWISLGSYPSTTEIMRNNGDIGPDDIAFHLDGYWENGSHATYSLFGGKPEYNHIREMVRKILNDEQKPLSSTVPIGADPIE
ncbi:MAG: hypothetical protein P1U58_12200 [Verrucomicrobiales bacterium]|nr:hypothetical protein [Verrucomicrobiales bacterium]